MTENKQFQIIHLGNPYDFVVKNHNTNKTYGTFQGDDKSLMDLLNELHEENQDLETKKEDAEYELLHLKEKYEKVYEENGLLKSVNGEYEDALGRLEEENEELKKNCKNYVWYKEYKKLLNDNERLKQTIDEMIKIFQDSGLDYVVSDEMEEILNE